MKQNLSPSYEESMLVLEKAHLASQPLALPHLYVHWLMFKLAFQHGHLAEVLGQIPRLLLAVPGSLLGLAPEGNVGSTRMGIFEKKKKN